MYLKDIFWNGYWAIIGALAVVFALISGNPLIVFIPLIAIVSISTFVGNMYVVKTAYRPKPIFTVLFVFIALFYFEQVLDLRQVAVPINVIFTSLLSITIIMTTLVKESGGAAITMMIKNIGLLKDTYKNYLFRFKFGSIAGLILEISLISLIIFNFPSTWTKIPLIFFWTISGLLFVVLRATSFSLKESLENIKKIAAIYGTARTTYFLIPILEFSSEMNWLVFSFLFSIMYLGFISALIPYIYFSKELKDTLNVMKFLDRNPRSKIGIITGNLQLTSDYVSEILYRLKFMKYVENLNKRWSISNFFRKGI